jgi:chromate transporter
MHRELVDDRRWISESRFLHALNYCMVLPGPEAQQLATYIGWLMHRTWGGIVAGALFVLPSLAILVALSWTYMAYGHVPAVAGVLYGVKPAVVALVLHAAWRIGSRTLKHALLWVVAASAFVAIFGWSVPFPLIVVAAGVVGVVAGRMWPGAFRLGAAHASRDAPPHAPAVIDDDTPTPSHARWRPGYLVRIVAAFLAIFVLALGGLTYAFGWTSTLAQTGWFFTKAALLTFGGAYAALPYVFQGAVESYGWLTATQMIDGLALGESTPGPLIMVVAFVAFVGGWTHAPAGWALPLAGMAGAAVATFFTFLPSFLFILAGGPLVESTHGRLAFTAPLTAITAAVVGVIVNLAAFFAWHVFWPRGASGGIDVPSLVLFAAATFALFRAKAGVIPVIAACGAAGLLLYLL